MLSSDLIAMHTYAKKIKTLVMLKHSRLDDSVTKHLLEALDVAVFDSINGNVVRRQHNRDIKSPGGADTTTAVVLATNRDES